MTRRWAWLMMVTLLPSAARAAPTLDEVFRSVNESIETPADPTPLFAGLLAIAGVILLVVVWNSRKPRSPRGPAGLNNPSRVTREAARALRLRRSELKQLRAAADGMGLESPLTLLLCPSLLASAMKHPEVRADRSVLASVARRMLGESRPRETHGNPSAG